MHTHVAMAERALTHCATFVHTHIHRSLLHTYLHRLRSRVRRQARIRAFYTRRHTQANTLLVRTCWRAWVHTHEVWKRQVCLSKWTARRLCVRTFAAFKRQFALRQRLSAHTQTRMHSDLRTAIATWRMFVRTHTQTHRPHHLLTHNPTHTHTRTHTSRRQRVSPQLVSRFVVYRSLKHVFTHWKAYHMRWCRPLSAPQEFAHMLTVHTHRRRRVFAAWKALLTHKNVCLQEKSMCVRVLIARRHLSQVFTAWGHTLLGVRAFAVFAHSRGWKRLRMCVRSHRRQRRWLTRAHTHHCAHTLRAALRHLHTHARTHRHLRVCARRLRVVHAIYRLSSVHRHWCGVYKRVCAHRQQRALAMEFYLEHTMRRVFAAWAECVRTHKAIYDSVINSKQVTNTRSMGEQTSPYLRTHSAAEGEEDSVLRASVDEDSGTNSMFAHTQQTHTQDPILSADVATNTHKHVHHRVHVRVRADTDDSSDDSDFDDEEDSVHTHMNHLKCSQTLRRLHTHAHRQIQLRRLCAHTQTHIASKHTQSRAFRQWLHLFVHGGVWRRYQEQKAALAANDSDQQLLLLDERYDVFVCLCVCMCVLWECSPTWVAHGLVFAGSAFMFVARIGNNDV
jgi:hypothetical protein